MTTRACGLLACVAWLTAAAAHAEKIAWSNNPHTTNLASSGAPLSGTFNFELGVFKGTFVPTAANTAQWSANWVPAQRVIYDAANGYFDGQFTVVSNLSPFTVNKAAYIWGFQGGVAASEWILFRHSTWLWPVPNPTDPFGLDWNAANATAVVGTIHASGTPFLMQSAAVTAATTPATTWQQWRSTELANEPLLNGPNDDPDHDGTSNLLEYVFGSPPTQAGPPPQTSIARVNGYQQITIPRRVDHPATLTVQVSSNLLDWDEGDLFTAVVSNTPAALVVRDLTPLDADHPQRFMRLKTVLVP